MLHNVTEGIGIVAPMLDKRPPLWVFAALTLLAGLPAVVGIGLGVFAFRPHWAAIALAVGAGAIIQVIVEVGGLLLRKTRQQGGRSLSVATVSGEFVGIAVMYVTALVIPM